MGRASPPPLCRIGACRAQAWTASPGPGPFVWALGPLYWGPWHWPVIGPELVVCPRTRRLPLWLKNINTFDPACPKVSTQLAVGAMRKGLRPVELRNYFLETYYNHDKYRGHEAF